MAAKKTGKEEPGEIVAILVRKPFRCGGKLHPEDAELEIDKDISKADAKAMVASGNADFLAESEE